MIKDFIHDYLPWLEGNFYGAALWVWGGVPLLFVTCYLFCGIIVHAIFLGMDRVSRRLKRESFFQTYLKSLAGPFTLLPALALFGMGKNLFPLSKAVLVLLSKAQILLMALAVATILMRFTHIAFDRLARRLVRKGQMAAASTIPLFRKMAKVAVAVLTFLFLLQNIGYDIGAILAALGVGGIAIALAAQKSIENLFGGISLALDQPIRIGDGGKFGDFEGTVEDMGLRSTRIRTASRSLLTIPNGKLSSMQIESFAGRDKFLFQHKIALRYETSPDQMRHILDQIHDLLLTHPKAENETARVRLVGFGDYALNLEVFAYILTTDGTEFLTIQEDLLLQAMDVVYGAGADFAFPSSTVYGQRGKSADEEKRRVIE